MGYIAITIIFAAVVLWIRDSSHKEKEHLENDLQNARRDLSQAETRHKNELAEVRDVCEKEKALIANENKRIQAETIRLGIGIDN